MADRHDLEIAGEKQGMRKVKKYARDRNRKPTATSPASVCRYQFRICGRNRTEQRQRQRQRQKRLAINNQEFFLGFLVIFLDYDYDPGEGMRMRNDLLTASD